MFRTGERARRGARWVAVATAASLLVAACGGDDDDAGSGPNGAPAVTTAPVASGDGRDETAAPGTATPGTGAPATTAPPAADGEPVPGGSATYLFQSELGTTFDPTKLISVTASIATGTVGYLLYGALVGTNPTTLEVEPQMLESLEGSDGGAVWTLRLRPGISFSDGTPFDAEAIKINWERHADPELSSAARGVVGGMSAIEVIDPLTLQVTLAEPNHQFPRTLAQYAITFIASPAAIEAGNIGEAPVGAGPFLLDEWVRDDHMSFVRNPSYWDAPRPYLDELTIRPITDPTQRVNALVSGQGDVAFAYAGEIQAATQEGFAAHPVAMNGGQVLVFNFATPLGSDLRFRQALRLAIDNAQVAEVVDKGASDDVALTYFAPTSPFYDPAFASPKPNLEQAQALIDEIAAEIGGPVEFTIQAGTPNKAIVDIVQAQLSQLDNVSVGADIVSAGAHTESVIVNKDFTVGLWNTFNLDPEPRAHDFFLTGSPRNYTNGYSNPDVDAALKAGRATMDVEERNAAYATLQRLLLEDVPVITVKRADHYLLSNPETIHGVTLAEDGIVRWDQVWVD